MYFKRGDSKTSYTIEDLPKSYVASNGKGKYNIKEKWIYK